jgi:alkyldihydroxyacetonephosphate synthase
MRWWGWGEDGHDPVLPDAAALLLESQLGVPAAPSREPVALEEVRLPEPRLPASVRERLTDLLGADHVRDDRAARVGHALGRSYPDLIRLRSGDGSSAPDLVVHPGSAEQVAAVLAACAHARAAVIPFGGGTSVVGGVEPLAADLAGAVSLDLGRLNELGGIDRTSLTARLGAGMFGPEVERRLGEEGLTLGHFPQSFEFSTVGGWVATRSAGQASSGYGRIDELVEGLRFVAPAGEINLHEGPASAAGPELAELLVGSEGVLGVVCEATVRVRPAPRQQRYEGWSFRSFAEGCEALRVLVQEDAAADVARLSDEAETGLNFAVGPVGRGERVVRRYLRMAGHERGCIAIVGFEGSDEDVERRRLRAAALLRGGGGLSLGRRPGEAWRRGRFAGPYLRDVLLGRGVFVDTLETATTWSNLEPLYEAVGAALRRALGPTSLVMCHVSHLYRSGASLYFTFFTRQDEDALGQWRTVKDAASLAIVDGGGTITHHHGVGRDHLPWMREEVGELGIELLRAAKERLDPAGIMNPGKLLPD